MRRYPVVLAIFGLAAVLYVLSPALAQDIPPRDDIADGVASDIGGERVERFVSKVDLRHDGTLSVLERVVYDFGDQERHGIFRNIPLKYNGGRSKLSIRGISVTDDNGASYRYEVSEGAGYKVIKIGDPDVFVTGTKTYDIRYEVDGAVQWLEGTDRLIWNVTGNEWEVPILEAAAVLSFFSPEARDKGLFACYQGAFGSTEPCRSGIPAESAGPNDIGFEAAKPLDPGEGLTFSVALPKGILPPPAPADRALMMFLAYWPLLLPIGVFGFLFRRWWRTGRDPKGRGTIIPQYAPPAGLSPIETGALLSDTVKPIYISAQIISLATRGFLKITPAGPESGRPKDYVLERTREATGKDAFLDRLLMMSIFSIAPSITSIADVRKIMAAMKGKNEEEVLAAMYEASVDRSAVRLSEMKNSFSRSIEGIKGAVTKSLFEKGYYDRDPRKVPGPYILVAFLVFFFSFFFFSWWPLLLASCLGSAVIVAIFGWLMPRTTKQGAIEKENIRGFRNYLDIAEKDRLEFHNAPEKRPELFERFLPYALALGVVDAWAREFKDIYMEPPQWYGGSASGAFLAAGLAHDVARFSSVAASTAFASSGGSGGGGGFSGGGAGGGGGGSW